MYYYMNKCINCDEKQTLNLICDHKICLFCLINLKDTKCNICNTDIKLPEKIKTIINYNKYKNINLNHSVIPLC